MGFRHEAERRVLGAIRTLLQRGEAPTYRDIAMAAGLSSAGHTHTILQSLRRRGVIELDAGVARSIRLVEETGEFAELSDLELRAPVARGETELRRRAQ